MSDATDRFKQVIAGFDARVQAASAGAWDRQSPCDGWTARDVVVHVSDNFRRFTGLDAVADGDDPGAAWATSRDAMCTLVDTGDLSTVIDGRFGAMPLEQLLTRIIATDTLVHTWDLARAVGADDRLDPDAVAGSFSGLKPMDDMLRRPGMFDAKIDPPAGADEQTQFLCFLGRRV